MTTQTDIQTTNNAQRRRAPSRPVWTYRPDTDILETPDAFLVVADIPGASADAIGVTFEGGVLTIEAQTRRAFPEGAEFRRQEFGVGAYHRRFGVDDRIDAENIGAEYAHGVLTVRLPKTGAAQRRQVQIRTA